MPSPREMTPTQLIAELSTATGLSEREAALLDHLLAAMDEVDTLTREVKDLQMKLDLDTGLEP